MDKIKGIAIPASVGFVLSFLISIISTHRFGRSLLRAILMGIFFALVAFGIRFLIEQFLSDESFESSGSSSGTSVTEEKGSLVDITISDEKLKDDDKGPEFCVANSRKNSKPGEVEKKTEPVNELMPNEEKKPFVNTMDSIPVANSKAGANNAVAVTDNSKKDSFEPVDLSVSFKNNGQNVKTLTAEEQMAEANKQSAEASAGSLKVESLTSTDGGDLDELPDIGGLSPLTKAQSAENGIISSSEFSTAGQELSDVLQSSSKGSQASSHDSDTMAKAIRTLLAKDK